MLTMDFCVEVAGEAIACFGNLWISAANSTVVTNRFDFTDLRKESESVARRALPPHLLLLAAGDAMHGSPLGGGENNAAEAGASL